MSSIRRCRARWVLPGTYWIERPLLSRPYHGWSIQIFPGNLTGIFERLKPPVLRVTITSALTRRADSGRFRERLCSPGRFRKGKAEGRCSHIHVKECSQRCRQSGSEVGAAMSRSYPYRKPLPLRRSKYRGTYGMQH